MMSPIILTYTVRPATALFLVPGIYRAIEYSAYGDLCYLVSCKFLHKIDHYNENAVLLNPI